ncbi:hypothetical protein GW923_01220 [Candidatus Pacearchaeota archaeon]|nr:hypothetical protein [Candidatus Pacearchaeota archaeon]
MDKKGFEFSFSWLFAIIVGAVIIFIAIYFTTGVIKTNQYQAGTQTAVELENLLNPVETNLEEGKLIKINFGDETRIYNDCRNIGDFGNQVISTSTRSRIGEEWPGPGGRITSKNKYVFSEDIVQGREVYVFAKPFEMPYKVADILMIYTGNYCFVNPPGSIEDEVSDLSLPGINVTGSKTGCPEGSKVVCFFSDNCDINVGESGARDVYLNDGLIYAEIFSDDDLYECQLQRLMKRGANLAEVYADKADYLEFQGCGTRLSGSLREFSRLLRDDYESSSDLRAVELKSEALEDKNELLNCKLF